MEPIRTTNDHLRPKEIAGSFAVITLREFWRTFSLQGPALARVPIPTAASIAHGLNGYFGSLTAHGISKQTNDILVLECKACRNCRPARKTHVCETHCGVIQGTCEYLNQSAVNVSYEPNVDTGVCVVTVSKTKSLANETSCPDVNDPPSPEPPLTPD